MDIGDHPPAVARPPTEFALTLLPRPGEGFAPVCRRLAAALEEREAQILKMAVFGALDACEDGLRALRESLGEIAWPLTWVEGLSCQDTPIAGVQVLALSGGAVKRVSLEGRVVGSVFEDGEVRHCLLGGVGPRETTLRRPDQAVQALEGLERALFDAGFTLGDLARTWFFNEDILAWYGAFNRVRTAHYAGAMFRTGSLPASTGVAGRNPAGAALTIDAWAVRPLNSSARVVEVASPLQCPAPAYGSSFSRAMEISSGGRRRLLVSGTASIALNGRTVWPGDVRRQIERTMEVVAEILSSRGLDFGHATRAVAYFKHPGDTDVFEAWRKGHGLEALPVVAVQGDICREDLLFEIELDACAAE